MLISDKSNELHTATANSNQLGKGGESPPKRKVVKKSIITDDVDKKLGRNLSHKSPKANPKAKEEKKKEVEKRKSLKK